MLEINKFYKFDIFKGLHHLDNNSIDCVVTSPPYWKGFEYEAYFNSYYQYIKWSYKWMKEIKRVLKENGTFWLNVINDSEITTRAFELMNIATEKLMFKLHDTIIWYRYNSQPANTNRQLTNQCEYIFMFRHTSNNIKLRKKEAYEKNKHIFDTKNVGNVWRIPFSTKGFAKKELSCKYGHSGFPKEIPETCILLSTNENDLILDCFAGSGTTLYSAKDLNREFIGFDKFYDIRI